MFDDVVNPLLERFLPSGSFQKFHPEPLLTCASEDDDNEKVKGGGDEEDQIGPGG